MCGCIIIMYAHACVFIIKTVCLRIWVTCGGDVENGSLYYVRIQQYHLRASSPLVAVDYKLVAMCGSNFNN